MIPQGEDNPYTIRIVSDILESNGSSSMATVCAGTLALMDAGIKMRKPVSGIAMGLISGKDNSKFAVLSDILGDEDHLGDMDFKVTGTKDGITACQMDIKVDGLSFEILAQALEQARQGRLHILGEMAKTITEPREDYKEHVPRIEKLIIEKEFIGAVIGPQGKIIQELQLKTNTVISIEEVEGKGIIEICSADKAGIEAAKARIKGITSVPEVGEVYHSTVKSIMPYGAFVEFLPGKEGLLHVSEISWARVENVEDVLKIGDELDIKIMAIDSRTGNFKLSHRILTEKPEGYIEPAPREPREDRGDRGDRNDRGGNRDNRGNDRGRGGNNNRDSRDRRRD
jgi:polyribonucleotide nucleotidyltransferase